MNRAVQPQKVARCLKFRIYEEDRQNYLCSESKGVDLCLCFRIYNKNRVSHDAAKYSLLLLMNICTLGKHFRFL